MTSNFDPNIGLLPGKLATDRYDFEKHIHPTGSTTTSFRHDGYQIDLVPPISISKVSESNVYAAFQAISAYITLAGLTGKGFVSIPDGYDTYLNQITTPNNAFDSTVPSVDIAFNDIFTNPNNNLHFRIRDGGIVLLPAGSYIVKNTINVPAGIMILGESFGTKIVNAMTNQPVFKIMADSITAPTVGQGTGIGGIGAGGGGRKADAGVGYTSAFMFANETRLFNLVISDGYVEERFLGDTAGVTTPHNIDGYTPLVSVAEGANFVAEYIKFIGKVQGSAPITHATSFGIKTDDSIPASTGNTFITVKNCMFDGVSTALAYDGYNGSSDYVTFSNNYVRAFGGLSSDNGSTANFSSPQNNCMIRCNTCNADISHNYFVGYDTTVSSMVYVPNGPVPTTLQSIPRMMVDSNNIAIKPSSNSVNSTFGLLKFNSTLLSNLTSLVSYRQLNNNFGNSAPFAISTNYTVGVSETVILVHSNAAAITVTLPLTTTNGQRTLVVKDIDGYASFNNITLALTGGVNFEGLASNYIIQANYGVYKMISDISGNWWLIL